jgi:hypothetical protein
MSPARNAGGRPPGPTARTLAAAHAAAAVQALADIAKDQAAPADVRVTAASRLLDLAAKPAKGQRTD